MSKLLKFSGIAVLALVIGLTSCLNTDDNNDISLDEYTPENEAELIEQYVSLLVADGKSLDTTDIGVIVFDYEEGDGEYAQIGDSVSVHYTGFFMEGKIFDSSSGGDPLKFRIEDDNGLIKGFNNAVLQLNIGAEAYFLLPSNVAYGEKGRLDYYGSYYVIPPYTPILFQLELVDIYEDSEN